MPSSIAELKHSRRVRSTAASFLAVALLPSLAFAQQAAPDQDSTALQRQVEELRAMVQKLQSRVDDLENRSRASGPPAPATAAALPPTAPASGVPETQATSSAAPAATGAVSDFLQGTTLNVLLDGYYGYNFNAPIGRANLLRAYDVSSNSFSLNQAAIILENAPDPSKGKRWGARLDFQFGQATQTLQGSAANESRPDIYRNIFQAYGTYVIPIGGGLTVDFGKWASAIGIEGNYTKDQINYSRSYWFDYLPFYHMGVRMNYKVNGKLALNYWAVNGTQETEANNGYKDELFGFTLQPHKSLNWTVNYYLGQEHPDVVFYPNGAPAGSSNLPTLQGIPFSPVPNPPKGKLDIFDSYATWQASPKLSFAIEGDWVIQRLYTYSRPQHTAGGAGYVKYQFTPKFSLAARAEYLTDRGGLFSGAVQSLKETTFTTQYQLADGFFVSNEFRRDFSNHPYFYTDTLGRLKKEQDTATVGLVWWWGRKQGAW